MKTAIFWLLSVFLCFAFADEKSKTKPDDIKPTMQQILLHIQALRPFMVSEEKFLDPKNNLKILSHLHELRDLVKNAKHEQILKEPGLRISKQVLEDHLTETERVFKVGNKSFARWELNSTFTICMSCHTQTPSASRGWNLVGFSDFGSAFDQAEFLFAARDFDLALTRYDQLIDGYPENKLKIADLETAVERKVAIFSRVKRDFVGGLKSIEHSNKNEKLPSATKRNLVAWEGLFRTQSKVLVPNPKTAKDDDIRKYVEKEMKRGLWDALVDANNPRLVTNLTVSGVLYEYLNTHPDSAMKAEVLYWLALCDRALNNNFFYSLADLYLKECIVQFHDQPIAKKCFKEFETNMILSYTGSSGEHVPEDVRTELNQLRHLVEGTHQ
jgi:hypothetical protein